MRIVQLIPTLSVGGAERIVALLAEALRDLGHEVHIIVLGESEDSWIERDLREKRMSVTFLGKGAGFDPTIIARLGVALRNVRPQVVHTHLHVLKYLLPTRAVWRPDAIVHTLHNLAENEAEPADQKVQQAAFRYRVAPVAIGGAVAESVRELYALEPATTIPNGIEVARFAAPEGTRQRLRGELSLPEDAPVFIVVGRLNEQKNHALLLRAFEKVPEHAHLLIVGDGDLRSELQEQAAGMSSRVHFLGIRRDVPDLLAAADAFVLASDWEGNPLVVMEAMSAGLPVVATAVGCVPELVVDGAGALVDKGDEAGLVEAITALALDPALADRQGTRARAHAERRFDVAAMAADYIDLYTRQSTRQFLRERLTGAAP